MSVTAATYINSIRDEIPDPCYDGSGNPLPATDGGLFRSQTLLAWLNRAVKDVARRTGWCVVDWFACQLVIGQPVVALDQKWMQLTSANANQWQLSRLNEAYTISPSRPSGSQPFWFGSHKQTDHMEFYVYPTISASDPTSTLSAGISAAVTSLQVASVTRFLSFGFVQIDNEILQYQTITGTTLSALLRGCCGTTAATHSLGATVQHLGFWGKGPRMPLEITAATDIVELPLAWQHLVELYVLERCARAQSDFAAAGVYHQGYSEQMEMILADPGWRPSQGVQIPAYGGAIMGPLAWGNTVIS